MRLNGSALNASPLGGVRRTPVRFAGEAAAHLVAELSGLRIVAGTGLATAELRAEFLASAHRFGGANWVLATHYDLLPTVWRAGHGAAAPVVLEASLFYQRTQYGFGSAELSLSAVGNVGVVFISGGAAITPMQLECDGAKLVRGAGDAVAALAADLSASAIRRPLALRAGAHNLALVLEPSHIDAEGVRYVGAFGDSELVIAAEDAGMLRQAHIGSLDFALQGDGAGRLRKPTLAGAMECGVALSGAFLTARRAQGSALLSLHAECAAEIHVRGDGAASVRLVAQGAGYRTVHVDLGTALARIEAQVAGVRKRVGSGDLPIGAHISLTGARGVLIRGKAPMELLAASDAYLNPHAEDDAEQQFVRPALARTFARPAAQREWRRN